MDQLGEQIKVSELLPIATRTQTVGTYGSAVVDRKDFLSAVAVLSSNKSTAGSSVSLACKMQHSIDLARGYDNSTGAESTDVKLRDGTASNIKLSAKFTQSGARQIAKVFLRLKSLGTITAGKTVTVTIETDSTSDPSGTAVHADATASVLCSTIGTSYEWVEFELTRPVDLADATPYHVVLTGDYDVSSSNCVILATTTVASGGNFNYFDAAYTTMSTTEKVVGYIEEYNFADVSGWAFTAVSELADSFQSDDADLSALNAKIRMLATITGASASFVCGANVILGSAKELPVAG